ncbi:Uncharacterized membrane protein [Nakamurella panacisegetis]|uniref:Uncharacterized membrane protein n=1 Tax=Nakamurella panacisegetis TaxID=1090615 RepID=A0A1H0KK91_9ACTN|nr:Uncharacterized membrane protein [Nakamurella panacisegetis]
MGPKTSSNTLSVPKVRARRTMATFMDGESFGTLSERFARYMGTSKFIVQMSVFILVWFAWNTLTPKGFRFDPYTFTFLTLLLSLQASYAAPLILLAQNRQDDRDRSEAKIDRARAEMDTEVNSHIARELSDVRNRLNDLTLDISQQRSGKGSPKDVSKRLDRIETAIAALVAQSAPPTAKIAVKAR